jgi:hypothetical protein
MWFLDTDYDARGKFDAGLFFYIPNFEILEIGKYGRFYYPVFTFHTGILRDDSFTESPIHSVLVGLSYDRLLNNAFSAKLNIEGSSRISGFNEYQFLKADLGLTKIFKLAPRLLLVPSMQLGAGGNLPNDRKYKLQDGIMRGYDRVEEGNVFANLSLDLVFPITFGNKQNILNLIVFRGIGGALFLEAGDIWDTGVEAIKPKTFLNDAKINGGVELCFLFTTIFDIRIPLTFGYGHNLLSVRQNKTINSGRFYAKFDTPVTLFTALFGY